ncbi:uncharacterized protein Dwil_GK27161 [Drosophila willistoni]|uniref:Uncharacterized protein n=1 Tax=Drosophila willistoni TaxID=7260 RepID=A0A0Q9WV39_DROWI|nr:uncharacterized protein Dwil_GK27161 [Drosophila willistoni]
MPSRRSTSVPLTYLKWRPVLWLSMQCVYFMLVVKLSQKALEMASKSGIETL